MTLYLSPTGKVSLKTSPDVPLAEMLGQDLLESHDVEDVAISDFDALKN